MLLLLLLFLCSFFFFTPTNHKTDDRALTRRIEYWTGRRIAGCGRTECARNRYAAAAVAASTLWVRSGQRGGTEPHTHVLVFTGGGTPEHYDRLPNGGHVTKMEPHRRRNHRRRRRRRRPSPVDRSSSPSDRPSVRPSASVRRSVRRSVMRA